MMAYFLLVCSLFFSFFGKYRQKKHDKRVGFAKTESQVTAGFLFVCMSASLGEERCVVGPLYWSLQCLRYHAGSDSVFSSLRVSHSSLHLIFHFCEMTGKDNPVQSVSGKDMPKHTAWK